MAPIPKPRTAPISSPRSVEQAGVLSMLSLLCDAKRCEYAAISIIDLGIKKLPYQKGSYHYPFG
jgi:hypothetical protein